MHQAASRLDGFAMDGLPIGQPRWVGTRGVVLTDGLEGQAEFGQFILELVVVIDFVSIDVGADGQVEIEPLQAGDVGAGSVCQEELDGLSLTGGEQMELQTAKVGFLAGREA